MLALVLFHTQTFEFKITITNIAEFETFSFFAHLLKYICLITGISSSLLSVQTEILLGQYFRLKLPIINNILEVAATVGQIITPILLGDHIIQHGLLRVILGYQAFVLQGIIISLFMKRPHYLKTRRQVYQYISVSKCRLDT